MLTGLLAWWRTRDVRVRFAAFGVLAPLPFVLVAALPLWVPLAAGCVWYVVVLGGVLSAAAEIVVERRRRRTSTPGEVAS